MLCNTLIDAFMILAVSMATVFQRLNAVSICDVKTIHANEGEVTSPGYPAGYSTDRDCTLVIDGGSNVEKIIISFEDFALEENEDQPELCLNDLDFLQITEPNKTPTIHCGFKIPPKYEATGSKVTLRFVSNSIFTYRGFKLTFTTVLRGQSICPSRYMKKRLSGVFFSPNYPRPYTPNERCRISVTVPDNFMMKAWFTSFHLQRSLSCSNDRISISDENGGWKMCGGGPNKLPAAMEFTGTNVKMDFKTDANTNLPGFYLNYNMTRLQKGRCVCTQGLEYVSIYNFKSKVQRKRNVIKFHFKTTRPNGLILFSKGRLRDYIYVGIRNGRLFYETDLGTGRGRVVIVGRALNDNTWHRVLITRLDKTLSIDVDDLTISETATTRGSFNRLDIPDSIGFFLGIPSSVQGVLGNFIGCIRDMSIDGREPMTNAFARKPDYQSFGRARFTKCKS